MTEKKLVDELDKLASLHGYAWIAAKLNYRDQKTVRQWISKKTIPIRKRGAVELLLRETTHTGVI